MTEEVVAVKKSESAPVEGKDRQKKEKPKKTIRIVIRLLPPTMTEKQFLEQIDPLPSHENFYFVPADWSLGQEATSRAYMSILNPDDVYLFKARFDGYVFVDIKGAEYPALIEFAPFQGLSKNKSRKNDPKCNSIETDPHYIAFLDCLKNEENNIIKPDLKLDYLNQNREEKEVISTPLLQYLANKRQERKEEQRKKVEEKRRQRDEEKQKKKNQIAKNIPKTIKEEDKNDTSKETSNDKKSSKDKEAIKEARIKRKQEKSQKRKQEYLNKLAAREKEKESKKNADAKKRSKSDAKSDEDGKNTKQEGTKEKQITQILLTKTSANNEEVSDSVKEFIKNIANVKEFIPRSREVSQSDLDLIESTSLNAEKKDNNDKKHDTLNAVKEKLEKLEYIRADEKKFDNNKVRGGNNDNHSSSSSSGSRDKREKDEKRDRANDFRRIRNKDRPSIEIYQPGKTRLSNKKEDGRSSAELKDYKSNPTSDCENAKKDKDENTTVRKKVTRYSERRTNRLKEKTETLKCEENEIDTPITTPVVETEIDTPITTPVVETEIELHKNVENVLSETSQLSELLSVNKSTSDISVSNVILSQTDIVEIEAPSAQDD